MNNEKKFYVYEYIDPFTNKPFYVGKGCNDRYLHHLKNLNDNTNPYKKNKIKKIINKGSNPIIKFIKTGLTETESFELEKKMINEYGRLDLKNGCLVNLSDGGEGQCGWIPNQEYRLNMSMLTCGEKNGMFGKKHTIETKEKIKQKAIGRKFNEDVKLKMSKDRIGDKNSFYGKTHSEETIEKIRQKKIGRFIGENNFNAKTFLFINRFGNEIKVKGGFDKFCNENNLSTAKMKRNINKGIILPPKKNTKSMTLESKNCVGWEVKLIC